MNIKKLVLTGAAAALIGGFGYIPNAMADDGKAADGQCNEIEGTEAADGTVGLYGEAPGEGEGCAVAEGEGGVPVNPLDDGHIGVYEDGDGNPGLYGDCSPREEDAGFTVWDPAGEETDTTACEPAPA